MSRGELRNALTCYHIHLDDDAFGEFVQEFDKDNNGVIDFRYLSLLLALTSVGLQTMALVPRAG